MNDLLNEKQKNGQSRHRKRWQGELSLLFGLGMCCLLLICIHTTSQFNDTNRQLFYPLLLLSHSPSLSLVFGLSVLIVFVGSMMFAVWRGVMWLVVIFAFLIGLGLLGGAFMARIFASDITPQQTLTLHGRIYHLVVVWDGGGMDSPTKSYMVFQCDGWLCHWYATPYTHEYQSYDDRVDTRFEKFYPSDTLFIDSSKDLDRRFSLRVGDEVYPIISPSAFMQ